MTEKVELLFHDYPEEKPPKNGWYFVDTCNGFEVIEYEERYDIDSESDVLGFWPLNSYGDDYYLLKEDEVYRWAELPVSRSRKVEDDGPKEPVLPPGFDEAFANLRDAIAREMMGQS